MLNVGVETAYLVLFLLCLPICLYVLWTDLKYMKILNTSVLALLGVWIVAGLLVIPFDAWLWRWASAAVVLVIGILLNNFANVGAGDAKFAAAAAPFFVQKLEHLSIALVLLAFFLLVTFVLHRTARAIPAIRNATPDWVSWSSAKFPMGLALVAAFITYLAMLAFPSFYAATYGALALARI